MVNIKLTTMFEVYTDKAGEFRFRLKASNGQTILASEGYKQKTNCMNGIESVRRNSQDENKFEFKESTNGKWYFNLKATNGQIIGTSEMYESKVNAQNGASSVKKHAEEAIVTEE